MTKKKVRIKISVNGFKLLPPSFFLPHVKKRGGGGGGEHDVICVWDCVERWIPALRFRGRDAVVFKRTWRHASFPRHCSLFRARRLQWRDGKRGRDQNAPTVDLPIVGEEHYSHWWCWWWSPPKKLEKGGPFSAMGDPTLLWAMGVRAFVEHGGNIVLILVI